MLTRLRSRINGPLVRHLAGEWRRKKAKGMNLANRDANEAAVEQLRQAFAGPVHCYSTDANGLTKGVGKKKPIVSFLHWSIGALPISRVMAAATGFFLFLPRRKESTSLVGSLPTWPHLVVVVQSGTFLTASTSSPTVTRNDPSALAVIAIGMAAHRTQSLN